mmetsp:Transcript_32762/g.55234  ORF Transcript_32762/g.55234 Transcript_32762/m.55234 type:complete len:471 (+) Transcript_32762:82-1494(+)|eukprot:CAMPEP_0174963452 /NCGR_PEP_ID=MMETSP0004_2-20121128/5338_1 /TAXON_ID=420556 /ORGANISM="Ochromonas sp., Strain CCMP1393" /LENGTH=470 /DNA_ID=CAMNT_0016212079 /DNA_START=48 /DNA_END=1460 /DNA_ORIENTATION=-
MNIFQNILEALAPTPQSLPPVKIPVIDVGTELSLRAIDGAIFHCYVLVPVKDSGTNLARCKYILAVTNLQIIELSPHTSKVGIAVAVDAHDLQALAKLKFKKGEHGVLLLEYKNGKKLKLIMHDPSACVSYIKEKMQNVGIAGNVKTKEERNVENAEQYFERARDIERDFTLTASIDLIQQMMSLLRRSAEKYEEGNDKGYETVNKFIREFLQRGDVKAVLESSDNSTSVDPMSGGEIGSKEAFRDGQTANASNSANTASDPLSISDIPVVREHSHQPSPILSDSSVLLESVLIPVVHEKQGNNSVERTLATHESVSGDTKITGSEDVAAVARLESCDKEKSSTSADILQAGVSPYLGMDTEFINIDQALLYHIDEENEPELSNNQVTTSPTLNEHCELSAMLDNMTNELDSLIGSFKDPELQSGRMDTTNVGDSNCSSSSVEATFIEVSPMDPTENAAEKNSNSMPTTL